MPLFTFQSIVLPQSFSFYQGRGVVNGYRTASRPCVSAFQPNEVKKFVITETALWTGTFVANRSSVITDPVTFAIVSQSRASATLVGS